MVTERWLPISGYDSLYEVSDAGNVRRMRDGRVLHFGSCKGYRNVSLTKDKKLRTYTVHRLVAIAFIGQREGVVRHLDGNRYNNSAGNLAWGTPKQNSADREIHGRTAKGVQMPHARRTEAQVREIKVLASTGKGCAEIGRLIGLPKERVHEIMSGKRWAHVAPLPEAEVTR